MSVTCVFSQADKLLPRLVVGSAFTRTVAEDVAWQPSGLVTVTV